MESHQDNVRLDELDHRRLVGKLDLCHFEDGVPGVAFWHPRGATLLRVLREWLRGGMVEAGWQEVETPQLMPRSSWEASGHLKHYGKGMFAVRPAEGEDDGDGALLKPMNCPGAASVYAKGSRSWRDLPLRLSEFGRCHRREPSGAMHGLLRLRGFEQDDGHAFVVDDEEAVSSEVAAFIAFSGRVYQALGFPAPDMAMSLRPDDRAGDDVSWDRAEQLLAESAKRAGVEPRPMPGEGAFYGPKLELSLRDRAGRSWQCGTIQLDLVLPARLGLHYRDKDGRDRPPALLHRAALGSLERMVGILLEHYEGKLPDWLVPEQVAILPVGEAHAPRAAEVVRLLRRQGMRVRYDQSAHLVRPRLGDRISEALEVAVPAVVVVGAKEMESGLLAVSMDGAREAMSVDSLAGLAKWSPPLL